MLAESTPFELTPEQFEMVRSLIYRLCGITLRRGKRELVRTRLVRRIRELGLPSFDAYFGLLRDDPTGRELAELIDAMTTNKTGFFREPQHFRYLREVILPELVRARRRIRIWSAGCSSGEEPYSIAITLREAIPECDVLDVRVLGTDISTRVLAVARAGVYDETALADVPRDLLVRHFTCVQPRSPRRYRVSSGVARLVRLARLNLFDPWPMRGPFDVIFCRNVMIYFDRTMQQRLIEAFRSVLAPGGYLLVGHSESLAALSHDYRYVQPAVYRR
ncbi:MAG TPA: protein-glutamate O-methyltransferase CheR [Longimicrobiales bacterium]